MFPFWILGIFAIVTGLSMIWSAQFLFGIIGIAAGAVVIIFFVVMQPKFPVKVWVFSKRKGSYRITNDKGARLLHNDGTYYYKLKKAKAEAKAAEFENLYPCGKNEILMLYSPAPGEYYPMSVEDAYKTIKVMKRFRNTETGEEFEREVEEKVPAIKPIPDELQQWMVLRQKRAKQRYMQTSSWEKFYPIIVIAVLAISIILIFNSLYNGLDPFIDTLNKASATNMQATERMSVAMERMAEAYEGRDVIRPEFPPPPPDVG